MFCLCMCWTVNTLWRADSSYWKGIDDTNKYRDKFLYLYMPIYLDPVDIEFWMSLDLCCKKWATGVAPGSQAPCAGCLTQFARIQHSPVARPGHPRLQCSSPGLSPAEWWLCTRSVWLCWTLMGTGEGAVGPPSGCGLAKLAVQPATLVLKKKNIKWSVWLAFTLQVMVAILSNIKLENPYRSKWCA